MDWTIIAAFLVMLSLFTLSGAMAWIQKRKTPSDYLVASRAVPPWLSALSAVSTNNSGFMFIGMIAYTYRFGIEAVWMMLGFILGDLTAWLFIHARVRKKSQQIDANTLPTLMGTRRERSRAFISALFGGEQHRVDRLLIVTAGLVTFMFLGVYAAGQLKAGSTALHALFEWDMWVGVLIGTAIVILYSYAGGIRADIWTDAAQSIVMIATMALILLAAMREVGGPASLMAELHQQDPQLTAWFPQEMAFGLLFYLAGFFCAGLGAVGQPHLMTRFFALESADAIPKAGFWYFLWYVPFFVASLGVGLYARAVIPDINSLPIAQGMEQPTELALPLITMQLLPDILVGVSLAGLFAATISTADSQIIVCSGALTQDIWPRWKDSYLASKLGTFSITAFALLLALTAPEGVFGLVLVAWSAMGASLGSVLILRVYNRPLTPYTAVAMMAAAIVAVVLWHLSPYNDDVFKILPGFAAAFAVYGFSRMRKQFSRPTESQ